MRDMLRQPFWQAALILVAAYVIFKFGIGYLLPAIGISSAPVPSSVVLQYMATVVVGVLLYFSADEARWDAFRMPIERTLVEPERRVLRTVLLIMLPLFVGWLAYQSVKPSFAAPVGLRSIHPAPPSSIEFRGKTMQLAGLENPLRSRGTLEDHIREGARVYVQNCVACHGDRLDGQGHFAHAFNPVPADFSSGGTISQLQESYVFWRIAKGGPGLPKEGTPWNSAMPVWEPLLTEDEIWAVVIYLYEQTGSSPRTWEEGGEGEEGGEH